jgi:hypothetical protein
MLVAAGRAIAAEPTAPAIASDAAAARTPPLIYRPALTQLRARSPSSSAMSER